MYSATHTSAGTGYWPDESAFVIPTGLERAIGVKHVVLDLTDGIFWDATLSRVARRWLSLFPSLQTCSVTYTRDFNDNEAKTLKLGSQHFGFEAKKIVEGSNKHILEWSTLGVGKKLTWDAKAVQA